jgi:hypothetical protein
MENRCDELLREPPGERPDTNYRNKQIAVCAADILDYHGIRPTRGNDAKPSLFEQIASSFLAAVTGMQGADLNHACRRVLDDWEPQNYLRNDFNESEGKSFPPLLFYANRSRSIQIAYNAGRADGHDSSHCNRT